MEATIERSMLNSANQPHAVVAMLLARPPLLPAPAEQLTQHVDHHVTLDAAVVQV